MSVSSSATLAAPAAPTPTSAALPPLERAAPQQAEVEVPHDQLVKLPLFAPVPAPQLLACGPRMILRLTETGFSSIRVPQLSQKRPKTAHRLLSVVPLVGDSALLLARDSIQRYYVGQDSSVGFSRVSLLGPSHLWAHPADVNTFFLHDIRERTLRRFSLVDEERGTAGSSPTTLINFGERTALPEYAGGPIEYLSAGAWLYRVKGGVLHVDGQRRLWPVPEAAGITHLRSAARLDRFWAVSADGSARLWERSEGLPLRQELHFSGTPISVVAQGRRLAAISAAQTSDLTASFKLEVYDGQRLLFEHPLPEFGGLEAGTWVERSLADRDLCLVPGRPWVVIGGRHALAVFDMLSGERLL